MSELIGEQARHRKLDTLFAGGLAWAAGAKGFTQLFTWLSVLIAARLLTPADYGLVGMAGFFYVLTNVMAEFGVGTVVLQMQELSDDVLSQLHSFSCLMCAGIFVLAELVSPLIASFFHSDQLVKVLLVNNLTFLITGFQAVPLGLLQKEMDYRRISLVEVAMVMVQSLVVVASALGGLGYWSLVAGAIAGKSAAAITAYAWKPVSYRTPHWKDIRGPLRLGHQSAIGSFAWVFYTLSDGVIVGRILGDSMLGMYQMAMNFASLPAEKISTMLMRAARPLFAKLQSDIPMVRRYFLILLEALAMSVLPLMLGLALVAPEAVVVVLGSKWAPAATPMTWLALFVSIRTMSTLCDQVLVCLRQSSFTMKLALLNLLVMPVAFIISAKLGGISAVAASWLVLAPVTVLPITIRLMRTIHIGYREMFLAVWPAVAGSIAMTLSVMGARWWLAESLSGPLRLVVLIAVGAIGYLAVLAGPFREKIKRYFRFVRGFTAQKDILAEGIQ